MRFTFDDGPSEWTPALLDVLGEYGHQATFFVLGQSCLRRVETLERIHADGHQIGNHGWTHRRITDLDDHDVEMELLATQALVELATGVAPTVWRAPYFGVDERVAGIAASLGLSHVGASVIPDDWASDDPTAIAAHCLRDLRTDAVVSLHDGIPPRGGSSSCTASRQPTVDAVRLILERLAA